MPQLLAGAEDKKTATIPKFGATQFLHVDVSAECGAERLKQGISTTEGADPDLVSAGKEWRLLPVDFLSAVGKSRKVVIANFWRNLRAEEGIKSNHLAVMDGQTVTEEDLQAGKFKNHFIGGQ